MKSGAGFEIRMSTSENQNKLQNSSSLSPIGSLLLSLSLQLSLSQIKHNYALQIDFLLVLQTCNPVFWPKNSYVTKLLLFGQIFATLLAKSMLIRTLQYNTSPFMLNKQKISSKLACQPLQYASCVPRIPPC